MPSRRSKMVSYRLPWETLAQLRLLAEEQGCSVQRCLILAVQREAERVLGSAVAGQAPLRAAVRPPDTYPARAAAPDDSAAVPTPSHHV